MFLKYVTETTELGVRVFGMVHGVVFIAYCLVTVLVARRPALVAAAGPALGLAAAVPPFATVLFDRYAERARRCSATPGGCASDEPDGLARAARRAGCCATRLRGALVGLVAVAGADRRRAAGRPARLTPRLGPPGSSVAGLPGCELASQVCGVGDAGDAAIRDALPARLPQRAASVFGVEHAVAPDSRAAAPAALSARWSRSYRLVGGAALDRRTGCRR